MLGQPEQEARPLFSQPIRQIVLIIIVIGLAAFGAYVAYPKVAPVFLANPWLNGFIALVFFIGVLACVLQVVQLISCVNWIEGFVANRPGHENAKAPRLLAPLAALLRSRGAQMQIGASSSRSILDSVATRIDEARDITRYITNLLIFLGLLGTFYGLATTVPAVVETIRSLAPQDGEGATDVFDRLIGGLESQLGGMGTAFASSLLGLAGSLVVGLLELFAGHGQNRFYRELEEWLSSITRLGYSAGEGDGGSDLGAMSQIVEQMGAQLETLQGIFNQSDASHTMLDERLGALAVTMNDMTGQLKSVTGPTDALQRVADGQEQLIVTLQEQNERGGAEADAESRMRLRSIDVQLLRILEEMSAGRQESLADLRNDLAAIARAVRTQSIGGSDNGRPKG